MRLSAWLKNFLNVTFYVIPNYGCQHVSIEKPLHLFCLLSITVFVQFHASPATRKTTTTNKYMQFIQQNVLLSREPYVVESFGSKLCHHHQSLSLVLWGQYPVSVAVSSTWTNPQQDSWRQWKGALSSYRCHLPIVEEGAPFYGFLLLFP